MDERRLEQSKNEEQLRTAELQAFIGYRIFNSTGLGQLFGFAAIVAALFLYPSEGAKLLGWFMVYAFVIFSVLQCLLFNHYIGQKATHIYGWPLMGIWGILLVMNFFHLANNEALPFSHDSYFHIAIVLGLAGIVLMKAIEIISRRTERST